MKRETKIIMNIFCIAGLFILCLTNEAKAYMDPGTGSFVMQALLAGLVGIGVFIKMCWTNIKLTIGRLFKGKENSNTPS